MRFNRLDTNPIYLLIVSFAFSIVAASESITRRIVPVHQDPDIPDLCTQFKQGGLPYAPVPGSCAEFYRCYQSTGETHLQECEAGKQFNEKTGDCIEEYDSGPKCSNNSEGTTMMTSLRQNTFTSIFFVCFVAMVGTSLLV